MNTYRFLLLLISVAVLGVGCIRDDIKPCPPLKVMIDIEDKNYDNVDFVEQKTGLQLRVDESQSFRSYIKKLFYAIYNLETGQMVHVQHLHDVTGDAEMATVFLPEKLPFGRYRLVVWGNIQSELGLTAENNFLMYDLHKGHVEGYDVYMLSDELLYDESHYEYVVSLKRVKGELIILAENFPDEIVHTRKSIGNLSGNVDYNLNYSEPETVVTDRFWKPSATWVSQTVLAPSASADGSRIDISLYDGTESVVSDIQLDAVSPLIERNRISVLRYVYDADTGLCSTFVLLEEGWNEIISLEP